jgi:vacuolar-type H+-ATPase subunit E/Vma4
MKPLGSVAAVIAAVREDAAADVDAIVRQADADCARLRAEDASRAVAFPEGELQIAAARERARTQAAHEDWLDTRAAIDEREAWLRRVVERGVERMDIGATPAERRDRLARLTEEAIDRLQADMIEVVVCPTDAEILDEQWRAALVARARLRSLTVVAGAVGGGCLVRTTDGRASFDNTYSARIERFRTTWRASLAHMYERAVQLGTAPAASGPHGDE